MKKLSAERLSVLKKYGFNDNLNCEFSYIFSSYCALDTKLLVQGSHATDHAYIHYACVNTDSGEQCEGLFYSSSLLEYLLTDFYGEWNFEIILKKIQKQLDCKLQLVSINTYPYFYIDFAHPDTPPQGPWAGE